MATSTPRPPVSRLIAATGSSIAVVDDDVGAEALRHLEPLGDRVDADDERRPPQPRAQRRAQADRALREHRHGVADLDAAAFGAAQAGREDVGHQHDLLVGEPVGNRRQVGPGVGHQQVLGPRAVDRVAEAPAAQRPATLRVRAVEAVEALAARRDGADDDALADVILRLEPLTELVDDADRLVTEHEPVAHRVLALDDVDVGAADRRGGDADDGLSGPWRRLRTLLDGQPALSAKCHSFHGVHCSSSCKSYRTRRAAQRQHARPSTGTRAGVLRRSNCRALG